MSDAQKKVLKRVLSIVFSILVLAYIVYQVYLITDEGLDTEVAYSYTLSDTVDADTFIVRNESYIKAASTEGTVISIINDGNRVSKGETVAAQFADETAASNYAQMTDLKANLERYQRLNSQSSSYAVNVSTMNSKVAESVMDLVSSVEAGDLTELENKVYDVREKVITRQIATGEDVPLDSLISDLTTQYKTLSAKGATHTDITSSSSGYYYGGTDGYESTVNYDEVASLTASDIETVLTAEPGKVPSTAIGKVYTSFDWYMLAAVSTDEARNLSVGDTVTVNLPYSAVSSVPATVFAINPEEGTEKTAIVLKCNYMNSDIAQLRKEYAEIVIHSYTGLKVKSSAIRVNEDGEKGVYVKSGNICTFKKLDIIYTEDDYVLSKVSEDSDYLALYDNVILEGKGLYDGKIIS